MPIQIEKGYEYKTFRNKLTGEVKTFRRPVPGYVEETDFNLPGKEATELQIKSRKDPVQVLKEEMQVPFDFANKPFQSAVKIPLTAMKGAAIPLRRAEATLANIMMPLQEYGGDTPKERAHNLVKMYGQQAKGAWQGVTGQRMGEFGDLPRRAGFGEPLSRAIGISTDVALGNILSKGKLAKAGTGPKPVTTAEGNFLLNNVNKADEILDMTKKSRGQAVRQAIDNVSDIVADTADINSQIKKIPNLYKNLKNPLYKVKFDKSGKVKGDINNLQNVIEAVNDLSTTKAWVDAGSKMQRALNGVYITTRNAMKTAARTKGTGPEYTALISALNDYSDLMDKMTGFKKMYDTAGEPLAYRFRSLFTKTGDPLYKQKWDELRKIVPELEPITKEMQGYVNKTALKQFGKTVGKQAIRAGILGGLLSKWQKK